MLTSLVVALGGLGLGWFVYKDIKSPAEDRFQIPLLKNKYYFDEAYQVVFIAPLVWFSEVFVSKWMDKGVIDSILHIFGPATGGLGTFIREKFDVPFINQFLGDGSANATYWLGKNLRPIQTGRIQQYLILSLIILVVIGGLLFALLVRSA